MQFLRLNVFAHPRLGVRHPRHLPIIPGRVNLKSKRRFHGKHKPQASTQSLLTSDGSPTDATDEDEDEDEDGEEEDEEEEGWINNGDNNKDDDQYDDDDDEASPGVIANDRDSDSIESFHAPTGKHVPSTPLAVRPLAPTPLAKVKGPSSKKVMACSRCDILGTNWGP